MTTIFDSFVTLLLAKADRWERTAADFDGDSTDDFRRGYAACAKNLAADIRSTTNVMKDLFDDQRRAEAKGDGSKSCG